MAEEKTFTTNFGMLVGSEGGAAAHPVAPDRAFLQGEEYGKRVAKGLELDVRKVEQLAAMSQDERVKATYS